MTSNSPFSLAIARGGNRDTLVNDCLEQLATAAETTQAAGNLGFLYATDPLSTEMEAILQAFKQTTGIRHWVGAVGYGICATNIEVYQQPALVVMLAQLPEDSFRVFSGNWHNLSEFRQQHETWYQSRSATLAQVHGSPNDSDIIQQIEGLARELPVGFLAGGLASAHNGEALQIADEVETRGLSGVMLDLEKIPLRVRHTQGCHPIGPPRVISESSRNVLVRIDDRPALEVLRQDAGELLSRNLQRALGTILAGLIVEGSDTGDYLARHLVGVDQDRGLVGVGDWVRPGGTLMFCRRDPQAARKDLERMMQELTEGLEQQPRGALYAACVGRGQHMFGDSGAELSIIGRYLEGVPLAGFFANGEVYHQRLYGYTGVLTLFL